MIKFRPGSKFSSTAAKFSCNLVAIVRRGLSLFLAVALCAWFTPNAGALTLTPELPTPHYDKADAVLVVVLGDGITLDTFEGIREAPLTLHKYVYCSDNPINLKDPSGNDWLSSVINGQRVHRIIGQDFKDNVPGGLSGPAISTTLLDKILPPGSYVPTIALFPDLIDVEGKQLYEIKPFPNWLGGKLQLQGYISTFNYFDPAKDWKAGTTYVPPSKIYLGALSWAIVYRPSGGVIMYDVIDVPALAMVGVGVVATVSKSDLAIGWATGTATAMLGLP